MGKSKYFSFSLKVFFHNELFVYLLVLGAAQSLVTRKRYRKDQVPKSSYDPIL